MAMRKIKVNDMVIVLAGKDKGRAGKVLKVMDSAVLVEGVNIVKKHVRPNPNKNEQGGILEREAKIHISNVAIYNSITKKADRVGIKKVENRKIRYFKSNGEMIEV